ncbi:MAG: hypothetical protein Q8N21_03615 [bacterium]|nr:hypothetical protein [bacterium]
MEYKNNDLLKILTELDLGSGIAEEDDLLEDARIETSVFSDLLMDRVDLIPGTKGSGKSALYRIFVEFLPERLLHQKKIVIAHGVQHHGDPVFHAFKDRFEKLSEDAFVDFWCIYFVSLIHENFLKNEIYKPYIQDCDNEINLFRKACEEARIPEIIGKKSLKDILSWCLNALKEMNLALKIKHGDLEYQATLFSDKIVTKTPENKILKTELPIYVTNVKNALEKILTKTGLNIWLMVDRLDEIFPRRSELECKALRGLLRTIRFFSSSQIKIKIFLRDDIFENIVKTKDGFTALTHVTSRKSDTLKWDEAQILDLILKRLLSNELLQKYLNVDMEKFNASTTYRKELFYQIFPDNVYKGERQSSTLRWIYSHSQDGNGVVTPRDIIYLITRAKQKQYDILSANPEGTSESIFDPQAILYGHEELSQYKKITFLKAEFPHLWECIEKLIGGKTQYKSASIKKLFGKNWEDITNDLISIGVLSKTKDTYDIPFLYRKGLDTSQGST